MTQLRDCPVCGGSNKSLVYQQRFAEISEGGLVRGYQVVVCHECGFGYADDIPEQAAFDQYYKEMSKYENEHQGGRVSGSTLSTYRAILGQIAPFLPNKAARIIDIGCATAGLLSLFKQEGYMALVGVDPSPSCAGTAQRLYGIRVLNCALSEVPLFEAPFDFLILNSVLEHIRDLDASMQALRNMLAPDGMIWIEVPDTPRFPQYVSAPFQQFSLEHINYFSSTSLTNLMRKHGFSPVAIWQNERLLETVPDPALSTLFRITIDETGSRQAVFDAYTRNALSEYVDRSLQLDEGVRQAVDSIVTSGRSLVVWGAGTHTQRLLASSRLAEAHIRAFVDSNVRYHGKRLNGIPIVPPERLKDLPEPILISSRLYQEEIASQIRDELRLGNEIIRLY